MTQMFVANATQQYHEFAYQVAESERTITQTIPPGGQVRLSANRGELSPADIECILRHHRQYGVVAVEEVGSVRSYSGICYSLGKQVPFAKLQQLIMVNRGILVDRGKEQRQAAAVAVNDAIQRHIAESGRDDVLNQTVVEIEERTPAQIVGSRRDSEGLARELAETPAVAEGVRVTREAPPPKGGRRRRA
jgi:hypothetical protein